MAYNELLADRVRNSLLAKGAEPAEKRMFGGLCFMVDDKMCIGVHEDRLMARIGPEREAIALKMSGCRPMDFTGRPMKGYVFVDEAGVDTDDRLDQYVQMALDFNPLAKASKKRKKQ